MKKQAQEFYQALHGMPETGFQEYRTSAYIAAELAAAGFRVREHIGGTTGVMGVLRGSRPGRTVVLRADMDAIACGGAEDAPLHACGHDAHAAMVLACGAALTAEGWEPRGELRLLFQPAGELLQGAKAMIRGGAVEGADAIVGIHLRPAEEAGLHEATPALYHGACGLLEFQVRGRTAHGGRPRLGVNAVHAAALAVGAVNSIPVPLGGSVQATRLCSLGSAANCIPDRVSLCLDLRGRTDSGLEQLAERAKAAVAGAAGAVGAEADCVREERTAAAVYDRELVEVARASIEEVLGRALPPVHTPGSEDFHFYRALAGIPSVYIGLGAGMRGGLHRPDMSFDTAALEDGTAILRSLAGRLL